MGDAVDDEASQSDGGNGCRTVPVEKSTNDKLEYRLLCFPSGFEAMLISTDDAKKNKAAASMAVGVGSFSDPQGRCEGLAHYLEHMLFMGSAKYPGESELEDFLSKNGGYSNAFTESSHTCYYFEVNKSVLRQALDMFAQLFVAPLMKTDSAQREMNAIDSEFRLTQNSDSTRVEQLFASFAKPGHPFRSFGWGSSESLGEATKKAGVNIDDELRGFYAKHYRAPRLRLCVYSVEPLDVLEAAVRESFAGLPLAAAGEPAAGPQEAYLAEVGAPFLDEALPKVVRVKPVKDTHQLCLSWQLPPTQHLYRSKPQSYLSHLVGHEGAGSLLAFLKQLGLATSLSAGVSDDSFESNSMCSIFSVDISLTVAGLQAWADVAHAVLLYLEMLRREAPQEWVHKEIAQVLNMSWRFLEERNPTDQVQTIACQMLPVYAIERAQLLRASWSLEEWRPAEVEGLLALMRPERLMVSVLSSAYGRAKGTDASADAEGAEGDKGAGAADAGAAGEEEGEEGEEEDGEDDAESEESEAGGAEAGAGASDEPPASDPSFDLSKAGTPSVEPLFGTEYWEASAEEVQRLLSAWRSPPATASSRVAGAAAALRLPDRNLFLATDFALRPAPAPAPASGGATSSSSSPSSGALAVPEGGLQGIYASFPPLPSPLPQQPSPLPHAAASGFRAWHLQDTVFKTPRSEIWLKLATDEAPLNEPRSARSWVLLVLLARALNDALNETAYLAEQASLHIWVSHDSYGLDLKVGGFHHKLPELLDVGLKELFSFADPAAWERRLRDASFLARVGAQREQLLRGYRNAYLKPGEHAADLRRLLLMPHRQSAPERAKALEKLGLPELAEFAQALIPKLRAEVLLSGNATAEDAEKVVQGLPPSLREAPEGRPLPPLPRHPPQPVAVVPLGAPVLWVEAGHDSGNRNVATEMYFQLELTSEPRPRAVLDLLESIMYEPLFDELRTKQQIGYVASCGMRSTKAVLGFSIWLLSSKVAPSEICRRVEAFLPEFRQKLVDMPAEDFERHVSSLAGQKLEPDRKLLSVQDSAFSELVERHRVFDRSLREAVALASVQRKDLLDLLDRALLPNAPKRRLAIAVAIGGKAKAEPETELEALRKAYPGSATVRSQDEFLRAATFHEDAGGGPT